MHWKEWLAPMLAMGMVFAPAVTTPAAQPARPNVVWLTAEDFGVELGCYGDPVARTPNIDRLASDGALYKNAFVAAPVCSPSRSAFMTGMYQTTIGAHNHRSHRTDGYGLPPGVHVITDYFRQAGYFTCNCTQPAPGVPGTGKTDFNFKVEKPFDGTDWSQRQPGQPFFAHVNFNETHRGYRKLQEDPTDPAKVKLPPYYPDHPVAREDWALYMDSAAQLDMKVGAVLKRLDDEGLRDNTIVLFFGDNGQSHVRGKQWLYDGGIHVPLIVRWPGHIRPGTVSEDMVSSIDFSATCLSLCSIPLPPKMEGQPFLGPQAKKRDCIFAARDRCDETVDRIRCVRTRQYKYIRNYYPERPYTQQNRYKERSYPMLNLMKELHAQGKLTPVQELFMADRRPAEELYDIGNDPHEINNLAGKPEHQAVLNEIRARLDQWIVQTGDQGAIPEDPAIIAQQFKVADEPRPKAGKKK